LSENLSEALRDQLAGLDPHIAEQQLDDKLGIRFTELTPERVVGTMPVEGNLQPYGLLHGGANAVLAETLGSTLAALNAGAGKATLGFELSCTHHRAARKGLVTGVATPLHVGRGTITADIVLTDDQGRRTCTARLSCLVRDAAPGSR